MMHRHEQIRERFVAAMRAALDAGDVGPGLATLRDAGAALVASHAALEVSGRVAPPVLQVSSDTLCVPVLGELNAARTAEIVEVLLARAMARDIGHVVLDLSSALLTSDTLLQLGRVFAVLAPLGVRGALSGVDRELAASLAAHPDELRGVRCFDELANALAAIRSRRGG